MSNHFYRPRHTPGGFTQCAHTTRLGVSLSGLCLLHCLGLPLIISLIPAVTWMENELIHVGLAGLALLVAVNAVRSWPSGQTRLTLCSIAAIGLGLLFFGALAAIGETAERVVTTMGALALASAHIIAWHKTRVIYTV